jgi:hypothetical protein
MGKVKFVQLIGAGHKDIEDKFEPELLSVLRSTLNSE